MFRALAAPVAVLVLAFPAAAIPAPGGAQSPTEAALESGVLSRINQIRHDHGLVLLESSPALAASALQQTREMAADGYFDHNSANGLAFWRRIAQSYPHAPGSRMWAVGENLLWSSPGIDPGGAIQLWMDSDAHRRNILDPNWRDVGIAALHVASAPGAFGNDPVTILTADFGVRR